MTTPITAYTVAKIKKTTGMEGYGYFCDLLKNGRKVAECADYGDGGPLHTRWLDSGTAVVREHRYGGEEVHTFNGTPEQAEFANAVWGLPMIPARPEVGINEASYWTSDLFIEELVNDTLALKKLEASLKKKLTVKTADGRFLDIKPPAGWTEEKVRTAVREKHKGCTILNDLDLEDAFKMLKAANLV